MTQQLQLAGEKTGLRVSSKLSECIAVSDRLATGYSTQPIIHCQHLADTTRVTHYSATHSTSCLLAASAVTTAPWCSALGP